VEPLKVWNKLKRLLGNAMGNDFIGLHKEWIRESNLIEGVDNLLADTGSFEAFKKFTEKVINKKTILDLHWDIMIDLSPSIAGALRKHNVTIKNKTKTLFVAPDWMEVPTLLNEWVTHWAKPADLHEARVAHILFEYIHPFADGNGRAGRIILNVQRMRLKEEPIVYYAAKRDEYYEIFHEFERVWNGKRNTWKRLLRRKESYRD